MSWTRFDGIDYLAKIRSSMSIPRRAGSLGPGDEAGSAYGVTVMESRRRLLWYRELERDASLTALGRS